MLWAAWIRGKNAATAKSLQLCPTLCDSIDSSPPGSPVPGILQARTLEWVAISFTSAWKWKVKVKLLSRVRLLATPWTAAYQAPPPMGFSRQEYWSGVPLPSPTQFLQCPLYQLRMSTCSWCIALSKLCFWAWGISEGQNFHVSFELSPFGCCSFGKSCPTVLRPHGLQHTRLLSPPVPPSICSNSNLLSRWCYLTISSSASPFSFCL